MSSEILHRRQFQQYNSMNAGETETRSAREGVDVGSVGLPSANSSQQLMPIESSHHETVIPVIPISSNRLTMKREEILTISVLCFVNLINYMDRFTIAGVLTDIQNEFNIGDQGGGLLQSVFILSYMVCAPLFGYLGDRFSRKWIMGIGVLLWGTTTLLGSFMHNFGWFITFRALVGVGEASYSTIAPTIISDLFVHDMRSKMLAMFYFAIPVGSGMGYIVGSETAHLGGSWRWALRVTPILGAFAVILIMTIKDPVRGASEGSNLQATRYVDDVKALTKNRSFMLSTGGFTCVSFVSGALAWFGPKYIFLGLRLHPDRQDITLNDISYKFGLIAMLAGLIGVPLGSYMAQRLRPTYPNCDPCICATGLLTSAPMVYLALILPTTSPTFCYIFVFLSQIAVNLCWSIVADILLYVVIPTRRATAAAFQILISHTFGDAISPFLIGSLSEAIQKRLENSTDNSSDLIGKVLKNLPPSNQDANISNSTLILSQEAKFIEYESLQYGMFSTCFVEVIGGIFFLLTAAFIVKDKYYASQAARGHQGVTHRTRVHVDDISSS